MCTQTVHLKGMCSSEDAAVGEARSTILTFLRPQPLLVFVPTSFANHIPPGAICLIFCTFLWSCLFTLADQYQASQYYIHIHILHIYVNIPHLRTYYEQILKYFNCVNLIFNTVFTFNTYTSGHDSEMLGIALVVHIPLAETENTVYTYRTFVCLWMKLHTLMCTLVGI